MHNKILTISPRGQLTIPNTLRKKITAKYFMCCQDGDNIILQPVQTRDEFFAELDERETAWDKSGKGDSLEKLEKKHLK